MQRQRQLERHGLRWRGSLSLPELKKLSLISTLSASNTAGLKPSKGDQKWKTTFQVRSRRPKTIYGYNPLKLFFQKKWLLLWIYIVCHEMKRSHHESVTTRNDRTFICQDWKWSHFHLSRLETIALWSVKIMKWPPLLSVNFSNDRQNYKTARLPLFFRRRNIRWRHGHALKVRTTLRKTTSNPQNRQICPK